MQGRISRGVGGFDPPAPGFDPPNLLLEKIQSPHFYLKKKKWGVGIFLVFSI